MVGVTGSIPVLPTISTSPVRRVIPRTVAPALEIIGSDVT